ncbi:MAG: F0F1 ATP synthase subunit gamma [Desulfomicrobium sp.]|nr:F0F1 ATP synthase subunit gamma [Desulfomicrobium sp.]
MSQTLEQLSRKNSTLSSIRGIVRTMKTLSAINAAPYEQAAQAIEKYQAGLAQAWAAFAYRMGGQQLPRVTDSQRQILVVFGSDHGLCGNYNEQLAADVAGFISRQPVQQQVELLCVGAQMQAALENGGLAPTPAMLPPASVSGLERLSGELVTRIEQLCCDQLVETVVWLAYTRRAEQGTRQSAIRQLLPLDERLLRPARHWPSRSLPDFQESPLVMLSALLRQYLFASLYRATAEAMVTENAARLALMQQAEQSVDERLDDVGRALSGVRQEAITSELMDIVIGHIHQADEED